MKLPQQKRILREDVKGAPSWVNGIIDTLNSFMESVYLILNHNVTLTENMSSFVKEIFYQTPSTYPSGVSNIEFMNTLKSKATGVWVMQVYDRDVYLPPPGPVYVPWIEKNGTIVVYPITGLEASKNYTVRLVVF